MKKVYVTGSGGLVGSRFVELCRDKYNFITTDFPDIDITDKQSLADLLKNENPDIIVHFAAYTNVGEAESQRNDKNGDCWKINVLGTKNLVSLIDSTKTRFIHISTDMVFSGASADPGPYKESHKPEENPDEVTWYGYTKAEGERIVKKNLKKDVTILRLIYPVRAKYALKLDYLRKPLSLFDEGKLYPLFNDQQVSIAFIDEITMALEKIIEGNHKGVFHASSRDTTTPYELISYAIEKVRGQKGVVKAISLKQYLKKVDNPVRYPMFGGLKVDETEKTLGIKFRTWKEIVDEIVRQISTS
ncbi:SDR family oxidoreductase [Patescibacteria group bacterium]